MLRSVCVSLLCEKKKNVPTATVSDFQLKCGCTFALRVQHWISGGISQRSASEARAPGDEKSLLPCERGRATATCEKVEEEEEGERERRSVERKIYK